MMSVVVQAAPLVFAATILTTSTLARGVYRLLGKHTAREYGLSPWRGYFEYRNEVRALQGSHLRPESLD